MGVGGVYVCVFCVVCVFVCIVLCVCVCWRTSFACLASHHTLSPFPSKHQHSLLCL